MQHGVENVTRIDPRRPTSASIARDPSVMMRRPTLTDVRNATGLIVGAETRGPRLGVLGPHQWGLRFPELWLRILGGSTNPDR